MAEAKNIFRPYNFFDTVAFGTSSVLRFNDDIKLTLGTDSDLAFVHRSTALNANTTVSGVIVGTPVTPAIAANSLIIGNKTADGDVLIVTQTGGNSQAAAFVDASANTTDLFAAGVRIARVAAAGVTLGLAGTTAGALLLSGVTSGVVTVKTADVAGTWTMKLPAAVGSAGQQLTDAAGDGVVTWAAASLGAWKHDLGILDPQDALKAVVSAPTHFFRYNAEVMPPGQWAPPDLMAGIFAEEAPWAMHGDKGIAFSMINAFGYARAAIQALHERLEAVEANA